MTYEEIVAKARKLAAEGNIGAAKRAMAMAEGMKGKAEQPAGRSQDIAPNPDGTYGQPPEGFIFDPNSGSMTSQELQANRMRPTPGQSARIGSEEGLAWGLRDEAAGAIAAASPGLPGTAGEQYDMAQLRARAELEAARRDHPVAAYGGEILGSTMAGGAAAGGLKRALGRYAPSVAGRTAATRAVTGAGAGAVAAGTYGFNAGEGGLEPRMDQALNAGKWGAGFGAGASLTGDALQAYLLARAGRKGVNEMLATTPTSEELLKRGGQMIEDAESKGATASPDQTADLAKGFLATLLDEGYITQKGKVVADSAPEIKRSLALADDFFLQSMTPKQMSTFRRPLQGAAGSLIPQEARVGTKLLKQFDDWSDPLRPGHAEGRAVYAKGARGASIDQLSELAANRAGQFSGSGYENALRTEYRQLLNRIIKGKEKGYSPEQIAAIRRVSEGGPIENAARWVGKVSPSNPMNVMLGGGMPMAIGASLGAPGVGVGAGIGAVALGGLGRRAATTMQRRNAEIASAYARGGKVAARTPEQLLADQGKRAIIEALLRYGSVTATQ